MPVSTSAPCISTTRSSGGTVEQTNSCQLKHLRTEDARRNRLIATQTCQDANYARAENRYLAFFCQQAPSYRLYMRCTYRLYMQCPYRLYMQCSYRLVVQCSYRLANWTVLLSIRQCPDAVSFPRQGCISATRCLWLPCMSSAYMRRPGRIPYAASLYSLRKLPSCHDHTSSAEWVLRPPDPASLRR